VIACKGFGAVVETAKITGFIVTLCKVTFGQVNSWHLLAAGWFQLSTLDGI
jgi:hypothetical protein